MRLYPEYLVRPVLNYIDKFQYFVLAVLACNYGLNAIVKSGFTWLEYLPKEDVVCILSDGSGSEPCTLE